MILLRRSQSKNVAPILPTALPVLYNFLPYSQICFDQYTQ